jgi:hypothetical protein
MSHLPVAHPRPASVASVRGQSLCLSATIPGSVTAAVSRELPAADPEAYPKSEIAARRDFQNWAAVRRGGVNFHRPPVRARRFPRTVRQAHGRLCSVRPSGYILRSSMLVTHWKHWRMVDAASLRSPTSSPFRRAVSARFACITADRNCQHGHRLIGTICPSAYGILQRASSSSALVALSQMGDGERPLPLSRWPRDQLSRLSAADCEGDCGECQALDAAEGGGSAVLCGPDQDAVSSERL